MSRLAIGWFVFAGFTLSLLLSPRPASAQISRFEFIMRADPNILPANGVATATISVIVPPGSPIRDGETVTFYTSAGTLQQPTAVLRGGQARVRLRAGTQADVATVSAVIGGINRALTQVEFTTEPVEVRLGPRLIIARGDYLAYNQKLSLIVAKGKCSFRKGHLTIAATNKIEYNLVTEMLIAEGTPGESSVAISSTGKKLKGERLTYHMGREEGMIQRSNPRDNRFLKGKSLFETDEDPGTLSPPPNVYDTSGYWITARRIVIRPSDRIMIEQASFHFDGKKRFSLPFFVVQLPGYQASQFGSRVGTADALGYNSEGGVNLDLPFYYRANASGSGALHLRHTAGAGFSTDQPGWTVALQDDYFTGDRGQGTLVMDRVTRPDWGMSVTHNHLFGKGLQANFFADSPFHRDVFSQQTFYQDFPGYALTLQTSQSVSPGDDSLGAQMFAQTLPRPIGQTGMTYFLSGSLSGTSFTGLPFQRSESANVVVFPQSLEITSRTSLQTSFRGELGHTRGLGGGVGHGATMSLRQSIGSSLASTVSLNLDRGSGLGATTTRSLSMNLAGGKNRFAVWIFGTRDLTGFSTFASALLSYRLGKRWGLRTDTAHFQFGPDSAYDQEMTVGYLLGQHELGLTWSRARHRFFFQVGTARF